MDVQGADCHHTPVLGALEMGGACSAISQISRCHGLMGIIHRLPVQPLPAALHGKRGIGNQHVETAESLGRAVDEVACEGAIGQVASTIKASPPLASTSRLACSHPERLVRAWIVMPTPGAARSRAMARPMPDLVTRMDRCFLPSGTGSACCLRAAIGPTAPSGCAIAPVRRPVRACRWW